MSLVLAWLCAVVAAMSVVCLWLIRRCLVLEEARRMAEHKVCDNCLVMHDYRAKNATIRDLWTRMEGGRDE